MSDEGIIPRAYQKEIFEQACKGNVVAAMETGAGKTFIAVLLIRWIATQAESTNKKVIFLVPKVPLVWQQTSVISNHTPLRVKGFCGALGVDMWDHNRWKNEFEAHDVLVMTAQVFQDVIKHAHWRLSMVSLLIFDEAHHCNKNSPYNQIMRDYYYHMPKDQRPKIFGMTASPIWNPKNPHKSLADLQANIDARVLAVRENTAELSIHAPAPDEQVYLYAPAPSEYPGYPAPSLQSHLGTVGLSTVKALRARDLELRCETALTMLGPYGADYFLFHQLERRVMDLRLTDHQTALESLNHMHVDGLPLSEVDTNGYIAIQRVIDAHRHRFELPLSNDWISPKVQTLVSILTSAKSDSFHGIIFVEQRHIAVALAWLLSRVPELQEWLHPVALVGHGATASSNHGPAAAGGITLKLQNEAVQGFRTGKYNLLVATSVAEEGLDFQACHLTVRFDGLQSMVGYVQSRGRARQHKSSFALLIEDGCAEELARYYQLRNKEPELKKMYQRGRVKEIEHERDPSPEPAGPPPYVVPSTGASLTAHSAISLLAYLCALIPQDKYMPILQPEYTASYTTPIGNTQPLYEARLRLPSALPLPPGRHEYVSPSCLSKKAAKRTAALEAVQVLHQLGVFDDHLLPARNQRGDGAEDADGRSMVNTSSIPKVLEVDVYDAWGNLHDPESGVWLHLVHIDGVTTMGLVTGSGLDPMEVDLFEPEGFVNVRVSEPVQLEWASYESRKVDVSLMEQYTVEGIQWGINSSKMPNGLAYHLIPVRDNLPDYEEMRKVVWQRGRDWSSISADGKGVLVMDLHRPYTILTTHHDMSLVPPEAVEKAAAILASAVDPPPMDTVWLELRLLVRACHYSSTVDRLSHIPRSGSHLKPLPQRTVFAPRGRCRWTPLSLDTFRAFRLLPALARHVQDTFRARIARKDLSLPAIPDEYTIEALTLPSTSVGYSYQRLETLGDSVLKLATSVHIFHKFPHRHEGQLAILRTNSINNLYLLARAQEAGLQHFLTAEPILTKKWRPRALEETTYLEGRPCVRNTLGRRTMADCMEALLGASFVVGGMDMALETGTSLGLCFGGAVPWSARYAQPSPSSATSTPVLVQALESKLGYKFNNGNLLIEAITHPSFQGSNPSYQRLEFLGDAVIDLEVLHHLFKKYPSAQPSQLTWARSRGVCNTTLAFISVTQLSLHKYALYAPFTVEKIIESTVDAFSTMTYEQVISHAWKLDPPKILADLFEALMGAVLVDSGYDLEVTGGVVRRVMAEALKLLHPDMPKHPISELMIWVAKNGCTRVSFKKSASNPELSQRNDSVTVLVHGTPVLPPIRAATIPLAKCVAAERSLETLMCPGAEHSLGNLCSCVPKKKVQPDEDDMGDEEYDDETEDGFAKRAKAELAAAGAKVAVAVADGGNAP
ncbi:hypothetical protein BOTBODRAFT_26294 [Botryobasidium botryosum FD-172 SS1]|uniref:RNase III domain-containing protein n=1 Tax=Botryobasidium botryosum (strain FD-172 SS1) TaxID=930990 RepID=A0A067NDQ1_BOTB1|nr:hypothetical protein BOTBODRAFT_26294 [Botryobasidium botryosum FD-172 SS1]